MRNSLALARLRLHASKIKQKILAIRYPLKLINPLKPLVINEYLSHLPVIADRRAKPVLHRSIRLLRVLHRVTAIHARLALKKPSTNHSDSAVGLGQWQCRGREMPRQSRSEEH